MTICADVENGNNTTTSFASCEQIYDYYLRYHNFRRHQVIIGDIEKYIEPIAVSFGLLANSLLFLTLLQTTRFSGTTFYYLRVIAFIEIVHSVFTVLCSYNWPIASADSYAFQLLGILRYPVEESAKLIVSTLTVLLSLERTIAVCKPHFYKKISEPRTAVIFIVLSFTVGIFTALDGGNYYIEDVITQEGKHNFIVRAKPSYLSFFYYVYYLTAAVRFSIGLTIVALSALLVTTLKKQQRELNAKLVNANERKKFILTKKLCQFQLIDAVDVCIDLLMSVVQVLWSVLEAYLRDFYKYQTVITSYSFNDAEYYMIWMYVVEVCKFIAHLSVMFAHFDLFFLYAVFNRSFREAFVALLKIIFHRVTSTVSTITPVSLP